MSSAKEIKLLKEIQDRLSKAIETDYENRQVALDDLEFVGIDGAQWPDEVRREREADGRPCLTINKMSTFIDQVVGDQRMNRPSVKVIPVDSNGDPEVARILSGWIRHVEQNSSSDVAVDHGFEQTVTCGYGALRVTTKYVDDVSTNQDAFIEQIDNPLSIYWGKHSKYDCSDAMYCLIITDMDRDEYKEKYKDEGMEFGNVNSQYVEGWCTKDTIRLAEYFVKAPKKETLYFLEDGRTVRKEDLEEGDIFAEEDKRIVESYDIMWYLVSGTRILESNKWVGKKYIPIIPIWGKELNVGGKRVVRSLIRNAKDSQRMFNYWNSIDTEVITLQPKTPYLVTPEQINGHEGMWNQANKKNLPFLIVNPDPKAPGWPKREAPPQASSGMVERIQSTDQEMRDTVGLQKASLGMQSNERSGVAIRERKMEGDVGTYAFIDNLSRSMAHVGRVLVDMAPGILDTNRIVRLGLVNGKHEFVEVNKEVEEDGASKVLNDISVGTYDVVVTVGPSFTTQRTEARQSMMEFIQYYPQAAPLIGDLYAKVQDWPGAEEFSERLEFLLPPEVKKAKAEKEAKEGGGPPSPPPSPPQPSPEQLMAMEEAKFKTQEWQMKLQEGQLKLKTAELKLQEGQQELQEGELKLAQEQTKLEQEKVKLAELKQSKEMKGIDYIEGKARERNEELKPKE